MVADDILDQARGILGPAWEKLTQENKEIAEAVAKDFALMQIKAANGHAVEKEMKHIKYQMSGLTDIARDALAQAAIQVAEASFKVLGSFARSFLRV